MSKKGTDEQRTNLFGASLITDSMNIDESKSEIPIVAKKKKKKVKASLKVKHQNS